MRYLLPWLLLLLALVLPSQGRADALVLIHGYFSGERTWAENGILRELEADGWRFAGKYLALPQGSQDELGENKPAPRAYYLVDLPSEAPLAMQAKLLTPLLAEIATRHPDEKIILVGHSAGGVVARLWMVQNPKPKVAALITIAAPHLGSDKAEAALLIGQTPLAMLAPIMGADTLQRSQGLYQDLVRERPGTMLHWLNHQKHPKAIYIAIIRREGFAWSGDNTVPVWSQDLRNVAALQEMATTAVEVVAGHELSPRDGPELVRILRGLGPSASTPPPPSPSPPTAAPWK